MRPLYHPTFELDKIENPTNIDQANENLERLALTSRRSFFGKSMGLSAAGAAAVVAASSSSAKGATSGLPSLYPGSTAKYFEEFQSDEAAHVNIVAAAIRSLGGTVRPFPTFTGITNFTGQQLLNFAVTIANTGVGALSGAAPHINSPAVYSVGSSILFVEAYHAGFANSLANTSLVPNGAVYDTPLTIAQVTAVLSPYIVSLNDNGLFPATFSTTTKSTANDIAILNFAIIIDMLEAAAYFYNVPRLFS